MQIYDGRESFYQWDIDQKITAADFAVGDEIHFYNLKQLNALPVLAYEHDGKVVADVPNILLQSSHPLTVYRYVTDKNGQYTIDEHTFKVNQRAKPDEYFYTETELYTVTTAVNKALEDAKASGEFDGADGKDGVDGKDGKDGYTPIKGVDYFDGENGKDGQNGQNGADGYTPIKGKDYYTDAEKAELVNEISTTVTGDIETALDNIIAIQNQLMGVSE